jgi:predicted DNA-binding transcriptional regulator AlpA
MTPRLLSRDQAAAYLGISPTQLDAEVRAGTFPPPFRLARTRRTLWDRAALDRALDARLTSVVEIDQGGSFNERRERWRRSRQDRQEAAR